MVATTLDVRRFTRRKAPVLPYRELAQDALPGWDISLVFAGETRAQNLNHQLRRKSYVPNVLSYVSGTKSGEIIICLTVAERQAPSYQLSYRHFVAQLFIHGLLHLKGVQHGATMERRERALMARRVHTSPSQSNGTTNLNRHRYRNTPNESRRR